MPQVIGNPATRPPPAADLAASLLDVRSTKALVGRIKEVRHELVSKSRKLDLTLMIGPKVTQIGPDPFDWTKEMVGS